MFWKIVKFLLLLPFALITAYLIFVVGLGMSIIPLTLIFSPLGVVIAILCLLIYFTDSKKLFDLFKNKKPETKANIELLPLQVDCRSLAPILYPKKDEISESNDGFTKSFMLPDVFFGTEDMSGLGDLWIYTQETQKNTYDGLGTFLVLQEKNDKNWIAYFPFLSDEAFSFKISAHVYVSPKLYNIIFKDIKNRKYLQLILNVYNGKIDHIFRYKSVTKKITKDYLVDLNKNLDTNVSDDEFAKIIKSSFLLLNLPLKAPKSKLKTPRRARA
jgi:hypothetical protein